MKPLTDREWDVMQLISQGYTNKEISGILKCSVKTIQKHREAIYYKWHVNSVLAMVRVGMRSGELNLTTFLGSEIGEGRHHGKPGHLERINAPV